MGASTGSKRERWNHVAKAIKRCSYCPPHGGENAKPSARPDRYKGQRKGRAG